MKNMKPPGGAVMAAHLLWGFVVAIAAIWLYAAIRPRYGPGPATALRAGFVVWLFVHATFSLAAARWTSSPEDHADQRRLVPPRDPPRDPRRRMALPGVIPQGRSLSQAERLDYRSPLVLI